MKINEINQPKQLSEGIGSALFGEVPAAAVKGLFTGKGTKQQLTQDIFLKDFYQDALVSLDNGIKAGFIDPAKKYTTPRTKKEPTVPPGPTPPGTPAPAVPTSTTIPPAKKPAGPTSAQATVAAAKQFNKGVTKAQSAKADVRAANEKLKKDAEAASRKPAFQQDATDRVMIQKARAAGLISENYNRLNYVFESILGELDSGKGGSMSITEYMLDWFGQYMNGVNWEGKKNMVLPYIQQIQNSYRSDKGRRAIQNLAKLAFSLSKAYGQAPAGAQNATNNTPASAPSPSKKINPEQLAADLASLKPREREEVLAKVKAATK